MYCPKCAALIEDTQKFCRACGANVSLVSQALEGRAPDQGQLSHDDVRRRRRERRKHRNSGQSETPSIEHAATKVFTGIGFCLAALAVMFYFPGGFTWGMFLFIPGFATLGKGIGEYLRYKQQLQLAPPVNTTPSIVAPTRPIEEIKAPTTSELQIPASVTEHTTKHLDSSR